jgi:predicted nucleic acid-binding protein
MSDQVFLDTGYVLALELANDQYHPAAQRHWARVTTTLPLLITTSYVFDEVVTYFNRIGHHAKAVTRYYLCQWEGCLCLNSSI